MGSDTAMLDAPAIQMDGPTNSAVQNGSVSACVDLFSPARTNAADGFGTIVDSDLTTLRMDLVLMADQRCCLGREMCLRACSC